MSLTHCPRCRRHCFTDAATCPSCGLTFQSRELLGQAAAAQKGFQVEVQHCIDQCISECAAGGTVLRPTPGIHEQHRYVVAFVGG